MRGFDDFSMEADFHIGGDSTVDTQLEVDLLCGSVGFDDDQPETKQWLQELRNRQQDSIRKA